MPKVHGCDAEEGRRVPGIYGKMHGEWKATRYGGGIGAHRKFLSRHSAPGHNSSRSVKAKQLEEGGGKVSGPRRLVVGSAGPPLNLQVCGLPGAPQAVCLWWPSQSTQGGRTCLRSFTRG